MDDKDNFDRTTVDGPARDVVGYGTNQPKVTWPDDANVAVNIVVNYEEGSQVDPIIRTAVRLK